MNKTKLGLALLCGLVGAPSFLRADNFNSVTVTNGISAGTNIGSTGGIIFTNNGNISAGGAGSVLSANDVNATGGRVFAGTYVKASQNLIVGGGGFGTSVGSAVIGLNPSATAFSSVVIGRNNKTAASDGTACSPTAWQDKDQLFVVGNGTGTAGDPNQTRNALTVYKDGTITMSKAQGDISMGQFQ